MNFYTLQSNDQFTTDLINHIKKNEEKFIDIIRTRLGLIIHAHQIKELNKTILDACLKFNCTPGEYLEILAHCHSSSPQLEYLILGITVGETYFFRDKHQMELIENLVLPNLITLKREQRNLTLRIWSAGCASGEEIYTLVMMLHELLIDISVWSLHCLGTDINTQSLKKALSGQYNQWSMRTISDYYKKKYFTQENNQYVLSPQIRDSVRFEYLNLNDSFPSIFNETNAQDLILCRNVLIYFDNEKTQHLMTKLNRSLVEGGYLLLGASDPVITKETDLIFYKGNSSLLSRGISTQQISPTKKLLPKPQIIAPTISTKDDAIKIKINLQPKHVIQSQQDWILTLLNDARWEEALDVINADESKNIPEVFVLNTKATINANLGKLNDAVMYCQKSLALNATQIQTHFTLATVLVELNRLSEAENEFRKTLYLDNQFVFGHFQLGLLLIRMKHLASGIKCLENALKIVNNQDPNQSVAGTSDLNYERLSQILKNELELYRANK